MKTDEDRRELHWETAEHSPAGVPGLDAASNITEGVKRGNLAYKPSSSGARLLIYFHHW